ncbi:uncharacterized protein CTRU02_200988 [Colletotrichum truncatum]|uniref:Integral membrane protein n=1 Tax=Colletotrichum truncatum TaxID=5467 RepID=A0ACC3ZGQ2_COLTU|nr:uncharacterized protein CTRU02_00758 [Colletotrichum truncatum]KAF6802009.1 integral membrane protein [Colletotrichum truncatum]
MTFVSLFMALRLFTKIFIGPPFHTEDCMPNPSPNTYIKMSHSQVGHFGGGFHVSDISKEQFKSFKKTSPLGVYAITLVYSPASYFTKLALLWIIIRVFQLHKRTVFGTYTVIVFLTAYTIPILFLKGFVCRPLAGFWDPTVKTSCYNQRAIFVADTGVSAVTDMAVLCLPIPVAATLRMSWKKRLKVIAMLSSGGVATAASIIRLVLVIKLQNSNDESVDLIRFNLLGTAEVSIGLICACLPAINILFLRVLERSPNSSRNTVGSSRIIELKFLRGSRLRTQHVTTEEVVPETNPGNLPGNAPQP